MSVIKKAIIPMMVLVLFAAAIFWVMSAKKINDRIPSRGVFVFSEEIRCKFVKSITQTDNA